MERIYVDTSVFGGYFEIEFEFKTYSVKLCAFSVNSVLNKKLGNKVMIFNVFYCY